MPLPVVAVVVLLRRSACHLSDLVNSVHRSWNDLIEQFVGFRCVVHLQCRQSQFLLLQFLAYTFGFGCAFENCDPRIGEIKRVIAADRDPRIWKAPSYLCYKQLGTKSKHTRNASAGIALFVVLSCARKWSVTVQSATPTCIWSARKLDFYCIGCHHAVWPL